MKICGITNQEDALAAIDGGANGHRIQFLSAQPALYRAGDGGGDCHRFGRAARRRVRERIAGACGSGCAHRPDSTWRNCTATKRPSDYPASLAVWKAARVGADFDFAQLRGIPAEALLLDGPAGELYGGAGETFDWQLAAASRAAHHSGGRPGCENVAAAVALARPWGVDACSRIETAPGRKDRKKMNAFLQAARAALRL